jgi:pheromone shutdown protein TraB
MEDLKKAIDEWHPDIVAVELDLARFQALRKEARTSPSPGHERYYLQHY